MSGSISNKDGPLTPGVSLGKRNSPWLNGPAPFCECRPQMLTALVGTPVPVRVASNCRHFKCSGFFLHWLGVQEDLVC